MYYCIFKRVQEKRLNGGGGGGGSEQFIAFSQLI